MVAGAAFAFAPYWYGHVTQMAHIQTVLAGWMPLTIFGLMRWLRSGSIRFLVLAAVSFVTAALTSWYQGVFLGISLITFLGVILFRGRRYPLRRATEGAFALVLITLVLLPVGRPYFRVAAKPGGEASLAFVRAFSASASSFVAPPKSNRLYGTFVRNPDRTQDAAETTLFPGLLTVGLAFLGYRTQRNNAHDRVLISALLTTMATGILLCLGAGPDGVRRFLPWAWFRIVVPGFSGLRTPSRAFVIALLSLALLAGFGARAILSRRDRRGTLGAIGLMVFLIAEASSMPIAIAHKPETPSAYHVLSTRSGIVLELPTHRRQGPRQIPVKEADYLLLQMSHWKPIANGWSTSEPSSYIALTQALRRFPDAASIAFLRRTGIRTVVVHRDRLSEAQWTDLERGMLNFPEFSRIESDNAVGVFDLAA